MALLARVDKAGVLATVEGQPPNKALHPTPSALVSIRVRLLSAEATDSEARHAMDEEDLYPIQLRLRDGTLVDGVVSLDCETETDCTLTLTFQGRRYTSTAGDYFDAFCLVRLQLEQEGILPICYGASRTVYPSGMCRDMARGATGYKLTIGQHGRQEDFVSLFASGSDVEPATVAEQQAYVEAWRASLRRAT